MTWTRATLPVSFRKPNGPRFRFLLLEDDVAEEDEDENAPVAAELHRLWPDGTRTWPLVVTRYAPGARTQAESPSALRVALDGLGFPDVPPDDLAWLTSPESTP